MNADDTSTIKQTAALAPQAVRVKPGKSIASTSATTRKVAHEAARGAKKAATKSARKTAPGKNAIAKPEAAVPREFSKKQIVLDLLRRKDGATMGEIAKATAWQSHSIRGFISGVVGRKMAFTVESHKNDAGERTYRIASK